MPLRTFRATAMLVLASMLQSAAQEPSIGDSTGADEDLRSIAVRQSGVLLPAGAWEVETGFRYNRDRRDINPALRATTRFLEIPVSARYGLTPRVEIFARLPLVWNERSYLISRSEGVSENSASDSGIGDIQFGVSGMIRPEGVQMPETILQFTTRAPTGSDPYKDEPDDGESFQAVGATGGGHWVYEGRVSFIKTVDPLVLYWGLSLAYKSEENAYGGTLQPGLGTGYFMGVGFAVNRGTSLSALFEGSHQPALQLHGEDIPGSEEEPMSLRLGLTRRVAPGWYIDPSVRFGLNDDATEAEFAFALVGRWN